MVQLPTFYISDCNDDNARARYAARIATTVPQAGQIQFVGVRSDLEAAGNLVDILDGLDGSEAITFLNVAPRGTRKTEWPNGAPFGYLQFNNAHIFTTIDGYSLSLLNKIVSLWRSQENHTDGLKVQVFDVPTVAPLLTTDKDLQDLIIKSQFRSFDFLPRVAGLILSGKSFPASILDNIPEAPSAIWWVDNFGNAKTTLLNTEVKLVAGQNIIMSLRGGNVLGDDAAIQRISNTAFDTTATHATRRDTKQILLKYYDRLKDIPFGETAIYTGSSGLGPHRFLEITTQKGDDLHHKHHAATLDLQAGDTIKIKIQQ